MSSNRFVWKVDKTGQGHVYDRITRKRVAHNKKSTIET